MINIEPITIGGFTDRRVYIGHYKGFMVHYYCPIQDSRWWILTIVPDPPMTDISTDIWIWKSFKYVLMDTFKWWLIWSYNYYSEVNGCAIIGWWKGQENITKSVYQK